MKGTAIEARRDVLTFERLDLAHESVVETWRTALRLVRQAVVSTVAPRLDPVSLSKLRGTLRLAQLKLLELVRFAGPPAFSPGMPESDASGASGEDRLYMRRLAALLAWIDQEHRLTADTAEGDPPFFVDASHLDAFADELDSTDWKTITRPRGRAFYADLAQRVDASLRTPTSDAHVERVLAHKRAWHA